MVKNINYKGQGSKVKVTTLRSWYSYEYDAYLVTFVIHSFPMFLYLLKNIHSYYLFQILCTVFMLLSLQYSDLIKLSDVTKTAKSIAVIGGGFLGSELAVGLTYRGIAYIS